MLGRNLTSKADLLSTNSKFIALHGEKSLTIPMFNHGFHSYVDICAFACITSASKSDDHGDAFARLNFSSGACPLSKEIMAVVEKRHKHVCGHATRADIRTLLERNNHWSDEINAYLTSLIDSCSHCQTVATPKLSPRV